MLGLLLPAAALGAALGGGGSFPDCSTQADGHVPYNGTTTGPFGEPTIVNASFGGSPLVVLAPPRSSLPAAAAAYPLLVFMHGSTAEIGMYAPNLAFYASLGFVVVFPFIRGPRADKLPITLNTDGKYMLNGLRYAAAKLHHGDVRRARCLPP